MLSAVGMYIYMCGTESVWDQGSEVGAGVWSDLRHSAEAVRHRGGLSGNVAFRWWCK